METGQQAQWTLSRLRIPAAIVFIVPNALLVVVLASLVLNFMKIPAAWRMRNIIWQPAKIRI